jgi:hypothetical protein
MSMRFMLLALAVVALASCDSATDIDTRGLSPMPDLSKSEFSNVHLANATNYWEMRIKMIGGPSWIYASPNANDRAQLDSVVIRELDATAPSPGITNFTCGIGDSCLPYVAAVNGKVITIYDSMDEFRAFLGDVDTSDEAALVVRTHGFDWNTNTAENGIRKVSDGWEVVIFETSSLCKPYTVDQVVLHVGIDASLSEIARHTWKKEKDTCYVI